MDKKLHQERIFLINIILQIYLIITQIWKSTKGKFKHNSSFLDLESAKKNDFNIAKEKRIDRNRNLKRNELQKESCFNGERRKLIYGSDIFYERKKNKLKEEEEKSIYPIWAVDLVFLMIWKNNDNMKKI